MYADMATEITSNESVYICSFGIFGGKYERDVAMSTAITVVRDVESTVTVKKVTGTGISNTLSIALRFPSG